MKLAINNDFFVKQPHTGQFPEDLYHELCAGAVKVFKIHIDTGDVSGCKDIFIYPIFHGPEEIKSILMN